MPAGVPSAQSLNRHDRYPAPEPPPRDGMVTPTWSACCSGLPTPPFFGGPGQGTRQIVELFVAFGLTALIGLER
ncbi:hypothetical protein ABIA65_005371 [Mycolicibacterium sp. 624]